MTREEVIEFLEKYSNAYNRVKNDNPECAEYIIKTELDYFNGKLSSHEPKLFPEIPIDEVD